MATEITKVGSKVKELGSIRSVPLAHRVARDQMYQHLIGFLKGFVAKEMFMACRQGPGIPQCL